MDLTLVVLAAGLGSRYGGLKQLDPVGPNGEIILDYSLFDARRAGFNRTVFIIRRETEEAFRGRFAAWLSAGASVDFAFQAGDDLPAGTGPVAPREKPWGTGHAVWCARNVVTSPFAVINADDFYGAGAFRALAGFLRKPQSPPARPRFAMVGYRLANTLSEFGLVSRGLCKVKGDGVLEGIVELKGIAAADVGPGCALRGEETVSMNCWGFTPAIFPALEAELREFLAARAGEPAAEFYLPAAVSTMVARGEAAVEVLPTSDSWFGVTYRDDRPRVAEALRGLARRGDYPAHLHLSPG